MAWNTPGVLWGGAAPPPPATTMSNDNKISATIPAQDKADAIAGLAEARAKLPFLQNLSADERRRIPTIGVERLAMILAFQAVMDAQPELVPNLVDRPELEKDIALWKDLAEILTHSMALCEGIEDTMHLTGSDILMAFGTIYNNVKQAARRNVVGADTALASLRPYFARGGGSGSGNGTGNGTNP